MVVKCLDHIIAVRIKRDIARLFERTKAADCREQLHAIISSAGHVAAQFLRVRAKFEDAAPTTGTRIAGACAIGVNVNLFARTGFRQSELPFCCNIAQNNQRSFKKSENIYQTQKNLKKQ